MTAFFEFAAEALLNTAIAWLLYVALEPYVRRFSPGILISWTRVLSGQIVDPRVGRDMLVGVGSASPSRCSTCPTTSLTPALSADRRRLRAPRTCSSCSAPGVDVGAVLRMIPNALQNAMFVAVAFGFGRARLTKRAGAAPCSPAACCRCSCSASRQRDHLLISLAFVAAFVAADGRHAPLLRPARARLSRSSSTRPSTTRR